MRRGEDCDEVDVVHVGELVDKSRPVDLVEYAARVVKPAHLTRILRKFVYKFTYSSNYSVLFWNINPISNYRRIGKLLNSCEIH